MNDKVVILTTAGFWSNASFTPLKAATSLEILLARCVVIPSLERWTGIEACSDTLLLGALGYLISSPFPSLVSPLVPSLFSLLPSELLSLSQWSTGRVSLTASEAHTAEERATCAGCSTRTTSVNPWFYVGRERGREKRTERGREGQAMRRMKRQMCTYKQTKNKNEVKKTF
jgi:hypothetical protein